MWGSASTIFGRNERTGSNCEASHFPLARCRARFAERLPYIFGIQTFGHRFAGRLESADHENCCRFGKSSSRLLEIRASSGYQNQAQLSTVDQTRATEVVKSDVGPLARRGHITDATVPDIGPLLPASLGSERAHGRGLVHQARLGRSLARSGR